MYGELLGPTRTQWFQLNILRVNKTIHEEAVNFLYGEFGVIMYYVHRNVLGHLRTKPENDRQDFPSTFILCPVRRADGRLGSEPVLTITIALQHSCCSVQDSQSRDEYDRYVGFSDHLPELCKLLTSCYIRDRLHVRLSLPSVEYRTFQGRLEYLLDCFQECRGVGTAEILDAGGLPVQTDLSSLMTKPLEDFDEILTRIRCYQDRAHQLQARRRFMDAFRPLVDARCFFAWWIEVGTELSNETEEKWAEFWDIRLEIAFLHASEWLRSGKPKGARERIELMFQLYPLKCESGPVPRRFWEKESEGYYIVGLCCLFEGNRISALYSFLQALISKPGHEGADKEIDKMEAAIENSDYPPDEIVRWNIKHVLERFRHQPLLDPSLDDDNHGHQGPANMTEDELSKLRGNFANFLSDGPRRW